MEEEKHTINMYDLTDEEELSLPLPIQWGRVMGVTGEMKYKNLKFGTESEEHPFILQALNWARRLPLPAGWVVRKTRNDEGEEDFFFCETASGRSGWDPPLLRECLSQILRRDGFEHAANRISLSEEPASVKQKCDEQERTDDFASDDGEPEEDPPDPPEKTTDSSYQEVECEEENLTQQNVNSFSTTENEEYICHHDSYENYNSDEDSVGPSIYLPSVTSTKSRRSQKWQDIKHYSEQSGRKQPRVPVSSTPSVSTSKRDPDAITQFTIRTLAAGVLENNESIHLLLMELREVFATKRRLTCNFLYDDDALNSPGHLKRVYPQESVSTLLGLGSYIVQALLAHPDVVVRAISTVEDRSSELDLLVYIMVHRVLHPFSSDNSYTTALLLEAFNLQIDKVDWSPDDDCLAGWECQSVATTHLSTISDANACIKTPRCSPLNALLTMLLLGVKEVNMTAHFWQPLYRPFLRDYTFKEEEHASANRPPSSPMRAEVGPLDYNETVLTAMLKSYSMRRDVSLFYRMVWKNVLPSLVELMEGAISSCPTGPSTTPERPNNKSRTDAATVSFPKLVSLASRIIESAFLDDVCVMFPATATAITRSFAETCGRDGVYMYLLNFLLLPNLVKLLFGDHDCAENEDVYNETLLKSLANKYFNYHEWWPRQESFVESAKAKKLLVVDAPGVLIWCVWRIYSCAVFSEPSEVMKFTAAKFFQNIGVNEIYTEVPDTRIRNVVSRMRLKINKGCECLLQLPLDAQGSSFLEEFGSRGAVSLHTKSMKALLDKRIEGLMSKPQEMLNAVVISRHDSMVLFDAVAVMLEDHQGDRPRTNDSVVDDYWWPECDVQEVLATVDRYLSLCDAMDDQLVEAVSQQQHDPDMEVEDVLLLWRDVAKRSFDDDGNLVFAEEEGFGEMQRAFPSEESRGDDDYYAMDQHMTDSDHVIGEGDNLDHQKAEVGFHNGPEHDFDNDEDVLDDVTMFSDVPPPPPDQSPPGSIEYVFDQLTRGKCLQERYLSSLLSMLSRVKSDAPCSLSSLLADESWVYAPEVDISHQLAVHSSNPIFDRYTASSLSKTWRNKKLSTKDALPREDYTGLAMKQRNFFNSLRFSDTRNRAGTRTSIDVNTNRTAPRLVNNLLRENLRSKHMPAHDIYEGESLYHKTRLAKAARATGQSQQSQSHLPRFTHVTVPKDSPLLAPTVSLCCKPSTRPSRSEVHQSYIKSLRGPDPKPRGKGNDSGKEKHRPELSRARKRRQGAPSVPSPPRKLASFPEHLRHRVRDDSGAPRSPVDVEKSSFLGEESRSRRYGDGPYLNNSLREKTRERKMPTPLPGTHSENLFNATISRALQLEHNLEEFEITAEQEKGWIAQLRSWEAGGDYQGRVIEPVLRKPFYPSGQVVSVKDPRRHVPEHLTPGRNRRSKSRLVRRAEREEWYDYRSDPELQQSRAPLQAPLQAPRRTMDSSADKDTSSSVEHRVDISSRQSRSNASDDQHKHELMSSGGDGGQENEVDRGRNAAMLTSNKLQATLHLLRSHATKREGQSHEPAGGDETGADDSYLEEAKEKTSGALSRLHRRQEQLKARQRLARGDENVSDNVRRAEEEEEAVSHKASSSGRDDNNDYDNNDYDNNDDDDDDDDNNDHDNNNNDDDNDSDDHDNNNNDANNTNNEGPERSRQVNHKPAQQSSSSDKAARQLPSRVPSSYSLQFAGSRKESPRSPQSTRAVPSEFYDYHEDEKRYRDVSAAFLQSRAVSRGELEDEDHSDDNGDEVPSSPSRGAERASSEVPLISKQHSVSSLAKKEKMMEGYEVTKYAEVGYGKKKTLCYDPSEQVLSWRPLAASVFSRFKGKQAAKSIKLKDVTEVRRGVESQALRKAGLLDPLCCLSISTNQVKDKKQRSLDVAFNSKIERDNFVRGLEVIFQQLGQTSVVFQ